MPASEAEESVSVNRLEMKSGCERSRGESEDDPWKQARREEREWKEVVFRRNWARNARASMRVACLEMQVGCIWATRGRRRLRPSERRRRPLKDDWSRSFCEPRQRFDNSDMCERGLMRPGPIPPGLGSNSRRRPRTVRAEDHGSTRQQRRSSSRTLHARQRIVSEDRRYAGVGWENAHSLSREDWPNAFSANSAAVAVFEHEQNATGEARRSLAQIVGRDANRLVTKRALVFLMGCWPIEAGSRPCRTRKQPERTGKG